jgi:uncharacterized protein (DUF427 family)
MAKAYVTDDQGTRILLADSDQTIKIEGNHYFPPASVNTEFFTESDTTYKTISVDGKELADAVFHYDSPMEGALKRVGKDFTGYYSFWRGVEVED